MVIRQIAPRPDALYELVGELTYKPGWEFALIEDYERGQGSVGLTFLAKARVKNSNPPHNDYTVDHLFIVPAASYDKRNWRRWLLDQLILVEQHECCEFFKVAGERPYSPRHGPGNDPYTIVEYGTDEDAHTTFRGQRV